MKIKDFLAWQSLLVISGLSLILSLQFIIPGIKNMRDATDAYALVGVYGTLFGLLYLIISVYALYYFIMFLRLIKKNKRSV